MFVVDAIRSRKVAQFSMYGIQWLRLLEISNVRRKTSFNSKKLLSMDCYSPVKRRDRGLNLAVQKLQFRHAAIHLRSRRRS